MPELASLESRIARIFEDKLNLAVPSLDTDLFATGGLDSLLFVELLFALEREFAIRVSPEELELENFQSISRIAEFVVNYHESKRGREGWRSLDDEGREMRPNGIGTIPEGGG